MAITQVPATGQLAKNANTVINRAKIFWEGLRPQQRIFLGLGVAATIGAVLFFTKMILSPDYKPLMTGLEPDDARAIAAQLDAKKIPYQLGPDGSSIRVPANQVDAARLEVASHDAPHSGRIGFEIFDKVSWGQTEFDEKVNYQRALEGELERTIQTIRNVKSARVHLVMAQDSVFVDREHGAKASVTLRLKHGNLSRDEVAQIARLVAGAVNELDPKDVVITDADANRTLGGVGGAGGDSGDSLDQELTKRLIATLTPVVGADRIRATVNVEYETGSSEENSEKYDPTVSVPLNMQRAEESYGGAGVGGVPGTSSNVPSQKQNASATAAKNGNPVSSSESATYGVNKTVRHVVQPAGGVRRLSAAIVLDDAVERKQVNGKWTTVRRKRTPEELKMINDLAAAAIGFNTARGDAISVENLSFDHPEDADTTAPETFVDKARKGVNDFASVIRYGVLLVLFLMVYLLMIRPMQKKIFPKAAPVKEIAARTALENATEAVAAHAALEAAAPQPLESSPAFLAAQRALALKKELTEFIKNEPEASTAAVRTWLREEV